MVILLYFFSSLFIVMGFMMLFAFHRTRRSELVLLSFVYSSSGLAAGYSMQWWPLIAGFVVAWLLKLAGYDPDRPATTGAGAAPPQKALQNDSPQGAPGVEVASERVDDGRKAVTGRSADEP